MSASQRRDWPNTIIMVPEGFPISKRIALMFVWKALASSLMLCTAKGHKEMANMSSMVRFMSRNLESRIEAEYRLNGAAARSDSEWGSYGRAGWSDLSH